MKRILLFVVLAVILVLGVAFAVLNAEPVTLKYYFGSRQAPLSLVIVLSLTIGALLGMAAGVGLWLRSKREVARVRKAARLAEKEVANLRSIPIRDKH
ncbi:MAG TPA: LapA family protein [Gammaproteobacteria bacterium]|nr:LapA family protein [Gammaproteobacteria bacterium]